MVKPSAGTSYTLGTGWSGLACADSAGAWTRLALKGRSARIINLNSFLAANMLGSRWQGQESQRSGAFSGKRRTMAREFSTGFGESHHSNRPRKTFAAADSRSRVEFRFSGDHDSHKRQVPQIEPGDIKGPGHAIGSRQARNKRPAGPQGEAPASGVDRLAI